MLRLRDIKKDYFVADQRMPALRGVSIGFRKSEFVAILGASGCGKTTLLNIIGGLDRYTSGDLSINGVSTKLYKDRDWDVYRNHSVGFVFQSYHLIPHQTVLANVELALTLSGVSQAERRRRAVEALEKVGLTNSQLNKLPRQMSGGQMQRVAIARAIVNNPEILLADEPTGALDSVTSVQIMDILKELSRTKLVIMVTHNPELAEQYADRIVKIKDGELLSDTNPYTEEQEAAEEQAAEKPVPVKAVKRKKGKEKKSGSMSFFTALSLSFRNLMTKKGRTFMVSFAGSIGIIGIALILSVATGVNAYIDGIERSTMSSYPLQIQSSTFDMSAMLGSFMENSAIDFEREPDTVISHNVMTRMMGAISGGITQNDLRSLKKYLEDPVNEFADYVNDVKYIYQTTLHTYLAENKDGQTVYTKNLKDYTELFDKLGVSLGSSGGMSGLGAGTDSTMAWTELIGDADYVSSQYDLVDGSFPSSPYEVLLVTNEHEEVSDYLLYMLGIADIEGLRQYKTALENYQSGQIDREPDPMPVLTYTYDQLYGYSFRFLTDADYYKMEGGLAVERPETEMDALLSDAPAIHIVGIVKPKADSVTANSIGGIAYPSSLMRELYARVEDSPVVKAQRGDTAHDVFTGAPFAGYVLDDVPGLREVMSQNPQVAPMLVSMTDEQVLALANRYLSASLESNYRKLGVVNEEEPSSVYIYPKDFDSKDVVTQKLNEFSNTHSKLTYTDTVALLLSSVTTIVNAISYVLVAFVAISLVVSSIMIGVITYISVLERIREIGILRAMGASKRDVARVFNAETAVIGFAAGGIGIAVSLGLIVIINIILHALTGLSTLSAVLSLPAALILIGISVLLTIIAGLVPSGVAARKDPVVALRTE